MSAIWEDDVEVRHCQQLGLARFHPIAGLRALALRAMPVAAAVVGNGGVAAGLVLTTRHMPAESRGAAALDRAHYLELVEAKVTAVGVTPSRPVVAEDIRDLKRWPAHRSDALCRRLLLGQGEMVERLEGPVSFEWVRDRPEHLPRKPKRMKQAGYRRLRKKLVMQQGARTGDDSAASPAISRTIPDSRTPYI
jgi:hypothetical protein